MWRCSSIMEEAVGHPSVQSNTASLASVMIQSEIRPVSSGFTLLF